MRQREAVFVDSGAWIALETAGVMGLLPIHIDDTISPEGSLFAIAHQYELSAYDATYLDLTLQNAAPLATLIVSLGVV